MIMRIFRELYDYPGFEYQWTSVADTLRRIQAASTPFRWNTFLDGMDGYLNYCRRFDALGDMPFISAVMENYCRALNAEWALIHHYVRQEHDVLRQYPNSDWWMHFYNFRVYLDGGGQSYWPEEFDEFDRELRRLRESE